MSIANTGNETIVEAGIIDDNDQTQARVEHLKALENLVGNSYPNKYERTKVSGAEDTISNIHDFAPVAEIAKELKDATPEGEKPDQDLKSHLNEKLKAFGNVRISGRLAVPPRVMGKAAFVHLSDGKERLQIYVRRDDAKVVSNDTGVTVEGETAAWDAFKLLDHGDFIGAEGFLFLTNTGELSVHVETFQFLSKSLLPMPDKIHGIADPELQRRYRYADLIASSLQIEHEGLTTREVFERRAKLISGMRRFLDDAGYIEVETPMLTPKATGAAAEPFKTWHKALDIDLYARIAPELYLKRLTVGGFEKVYELNRNFRNEGLSHKHNPEFTMLEFYCAYMDVNGMMDFAEAMIKESVQKATGGSLVVNYGETEIDFEKPFERISMKQSIAKYYASNNDNFENEYLNNLDNLSKLFLSVILDDEIRKGFGESIKKETLKGFPETYGNLSPDFLPVVTKFQKDLDENLVGQDERQIKLIIDFVARKEGELDSEVEKLLNNLRTDFDQTAKKYHLSTYKILNNTFNPNVSLENQHAKIIQYLFEEFVEEKLIQPTFIIDYPKSISPLSKASPENPNIAERFELFINGMECANGFSELNDPQEQYERFVDQMKERDAGDAEAMVLDEDYIRALSYGMPPAAGIGIGIDRLVMLLTNKHSIRDVILFPHMRPVVKEEEKRSEGEEETES